MIVEREGKAKTMSISLSTRASEDELTQGSRFGDKGDSTFKLVRSERAVTS